MNESDSPLKQATQKTPGIGEWARFKHQFATAWKFGWRDAMGYFRRHKWFSVAFLAMVVSIAYFVIHPYDQEFLKELRGPEEVNPKVKHWADRIGFWGDFAQYNLTFFLGVWIAGRMRKSRRLRRIAICLFIAPVIAGVFANVFRFTLGRPRPKMVGQVQQVTGKKYVDEFTGPTFSQSLQSFPSGHSATAFGTATPLLILMPEFGIPATIFAGSVAWARMYQNNHYPSDTFTGGMIGVLSGLACALPLRRRLRNLAKSGRKGA